MRYSKCLNSQLKWNVNPKTVLGGDMNSKYDVYKRLPDDRLVWLDRVMTLGEARQLVARLVSASIARYLVYDFRERFVVEVLGPQAADSRELAAKPLFSQAAK
jgi:hypothetical protein